MTAASTDWSDLPLADQPVSENDILQDLEDLGKGIVPPKLNFASLRKSILEPALFELGFHRQGIGYCKEFDAFIASIEIMRSKDNRAFRIDLGLQPAAMWNPAAHGEWPATASMFRGDINFPDGLCWWKHGLDEAVTRTVLHAAAGYLRAELLPGLQQMADFCEAAKPPQLADAPAWLSLAMSDEVSFARYRHAAGRKAEAAEFARAALAQMPQPGPLTPLQSPRPVELEMRDLAEGGG
ncbi:hypothetical protein [Altererythrobacter sp. Z27]|uniref:hypothetical protein n=1 Tax=Altererythrobacter sp. Z27 TaxID=3461147 RepID=UPI0040449650